MRNEILTAICCYNESQDPNRKGVGFYMSYQGKWNSEMIHELEIVSKNCIRHLKASIWRPARKRGQLRTDRFLTVPMRLPKLHFFLVHVTEFVELENYWTIFSEEGCEHLRQQSKYI